MNLSDLAKNPLFIDRVVRNKVTNFAFWVTDAPGVPAVLFLLIALSCLLSFQFSLAFRWLVAALGCTFLSYFLFKIFTQFTFAANELKTVLAGKLIRLPSTPSVIVLIDDIELEDAEEEQHHYEYLKIIKFKMKAYSWSINNRKDTLELQQAAISFKSNDREKFQCIGSLKGLGKYFVEDWEVDTISSPWRALSMMIIKG